MPIRTASIAAMQVALAEVGIGPDVATVSKIASLSREGLAPPRPAGGPPSAETVAHYARAIELTRQGKGRTGVALALAIAGFDIAERVVRADMRSVLGFSAAGAPKLSDKPDETDHQVEELYRQLSKRAQASPGNPLSILRRHVTAQKDRDGWTSVDQQRDYFSHEIVSAAAGSKGIPMEEHVEVYARAAGIPCPDTADPEYATFVGMAEVAETAPIPELIERTRSMLPAAAIIAKYSRLPADPLATTCNAFRLALTLPAEPLVPASRFGELVELFGQMMETSFRGEKPSFAGE